MTNTTAPQEAQQEQLAPCPFCNKEVTVEYVRLSAKSQWYIINCECDSYSWGHDTEKQAIVAWNRRAREDELRARVEALEGELAVTLFEVIDAGARFGKDDIEVYKARYLELTGRDYDTEATDGQ